MIFQFSIRTILLCTLCAFTAFDLNAQFGKLLKEADKVKKDANNVVKDVKKTTNGSHSNSSTRSTGSSSTTNASNTKPDAGGRDWYVSCQNGSGKEGTADKPAKEIAAIALQLKAGDIIHLAEGIYRGKTDMSSDIITVPVSIIGGYSLDFAQRDPWGAHKTILSGVNGYMKSETTSRLAIQCSKTHKEYSSQITIDGLIIDNGDRNFYVTKTKDKYIKRKASPEEGFNPTPDSPGIEIDMATGANIVVRNCAFINIAASQGVLDIQVGKNSRVLVENNLFVNNTGEAIYAKTAWQATDGHPQYTIKNNTILFTWRYDEAASYHGGTAIKADERILLEAENNLFAFCDEGGVDNIKKCKAITLNNNLFTGNQKFDYREYNTALTVSDMVDYADYAKGGGNETQTIKIPVSTAWSSVYMSRVLPSRASIDGGSQTPNSGINALRSMLGLPVQGTSVGAQSEVWLNRISLDDALKTGMQPYNGRGCSKP